MKRILFIAFILASLTSCGSMPIKDVSPNCILNGTFLIQYNQSEYVTIVKTDESGNIISEIQSPDTLKNISVICNSSGTFAKCGEVQLECTDGYYPFSQLFEVVSLIKNSEPIATTKNENIFVLKYKNGNESFSVVTDSSGTIKEIKTELCNYSKR